MMAARFPVSPFMSRAAALAVLLLLSGCERWPDDPRDSLAAAEQRGALRVGVVANPPWVKPDPPEAPGGIESALVRDFAEQVGLEVQWYHAGVEQQIDALKNFELDLLIGGFSAAHPWKAEVSQTFPYFIDKRQDGARGKHVILSAPGENALLTELERFLFANRDPQRFLPHLREAPQP